MQAKRLVKSSIIAVETTEQEVDDEDFIQDNAEVTDFVKAHRGSEIPPGPTEPQGDCLLASALVHCPDCIALNDLCDCYMQVVCHA